MKKVKKFLARSLFCLALPVGLLGSIQTAPAQHIAQMKARTVSAQTMAQIAPAQPMTSLSAAAPLSVSPPSGVVSDPQTRSITMSMGLPSNAVRNIVQDKDGFIWFGTDDGLCRYDGYAVQVFSNPHTKLDQFVCALDTCAEGVLVGTTKGAYLLNFEQKNFLQLSEKMKSLVTQFVVDGNRNVWIATKGQGVFCYNLDTQQCKNYPVKMLQGRVDAILVDATNQVWGLANGKLGGLVRLDKHSGTFRTVALHGDATSVRGTAMLDMGDGSIMVGTWEQGLFQVTADGSVKMLLSAALTNCLRCIHCLYNDRGLFVYIGCDDGMVEYDLKRQSWRMLSEVWNPSRSSVERFVYSITGDRENGLWVGTYYGGVSYIPPQSFENRFTSYVPRLGGLRGSVVSHLCEDAKRRIWIATDDGGLECMDIDSRKMVDFPGRAAMSTLNVHALLPEGDVLWVGTYGNGVIRLNTLTGEMLTYQTDGRPEGSNCYNIYRDKKGRLWATTLEHVNLWDEQRQQFRPVGPIKSCALDIDEDRYGNVWFATQGSGLWCYRTNNRWKQYEHVDGDTTTVCSNVVNSMTFARRGTLYVATSNGLCAYQPATDDFRRIHLMSPSLDFRCIIPFEGEFWLSTTKGLVRYVPGGEVRAFDEHDGLPSNVCMVNSGIITSYGRICFGTNKGFCSFFPDDMQYNEVPPPVAIVSFELFGKTEKKGMFGFGEKSDRSEKSSSSDEKSNSSDEKDASSDVENGSLDGATESDKMDVSGGLKGMDVELAKTETTAKPMLLNHVKELHLDYDENMFAITFAALSYVSPEKNTYCFKMDGMDRKWYFTHSNRAVYTNLSPGTYTFRVRAANNDGVWSKQEALLKIVVHPPLWWTLPAKLLYLFVFCVLFYWGMTVRLKRAERRHQQELNRLEEEWQRLSVAYTGNPDVPSFHVTKSEVSEASDASKAKLEKGENLLDGKTARKDDKMKTVSEVIGIDNGQIGIGYGKVGMLGERKLSEADVKFLEKLMQIVEDNMGNPHLNVAFVAEQLGMGRSSLFLKLKGMTNITPNDLMMLVRLKRAAALLREGGCQVAEVSYRCGFSSPSYFGKCFQKQFGVRPTDYK